MKYYKLQPLRFKKNKSFIYFFATKIINGSEKTFKQIVIRPNGTRVKMHITWNMNNFPNNLWSKKEITKEEFFIYCI